MRERENGLARMQRPYLKRSTKCPLVYAFAMVVWRYRRPSERQIGREALQRNEASRRIASRRVERDGKSWSALAHKRKRKQRNEMWKRETNGRGRGREIEARQTRGVGSSWQGDGIGRKQQQFPLSGAAGCYHEKQASTLIF